jgi:hypothetical protein
MELWVTAQARETSLVNNINHYLTKKEKHGIQDTSYMHAASMIEGPPPLTNNFKNPFGPSYYGSVANFPVKKLQLKRTSISEGAFKSKNQ